MADRLDDWGWPRLLLAGLCVAFAATVVYAGATSTVALGAYNPTWNGVSEVRGAAGDTGTEVVVGTATADYDDVTANATTAVVFSPERAYTAAEVDRLRQFVADGGTLLVAEDYGARTNPLLRGLGVPVRVNGSVVRDERNYGPSPAFPHATDTATHPYTAGVDRLTLNRGTTLDPAAPTNRSAVAALSDADNVTLLANTSGFAYHDTDDDGKLDGDESLRRRPVAATASVGAGEVVVVADASVFLNTMLERSGNRRFLTNVVGARETVLLDYSHSSGQPPLAALVILLRQSDAAAAAALAVIVASWAVVRDGRAPRRLRPAVARLTAPIRRRVDGPAASDIDRSPASDRAELVAYLRERHPEWEEDRIERVIAGVMPADDRDDDTSDDHVE